MFAEQQSRRSRRCRETGPPPPARSRAQRWRNRVLTKRDGTRPSAACGAWERLVAQTLTEIVGDYVPLGHGALRGLCLRAETRHARGERPAGSRAAPRRRLGSSATTWPGTRPADFGDAGEVVTMLRLSPPDDVAAGSVGDDVVVAHVAVGDYRILVRRNRAVARREVDPGGESRLVVRLVLIRVVA